MHFIPLDSVVVNSFFWILMVWVFVSFFQVIRHFKGNGSCRLLIGLGLGLIVAAILFYPLEATGNLYQRTNEMIDLKTIAGPKFFLKFCFDSVSNLINVFFVDGKDVPWVGPDHLTMFSLHAAVLILLGLAFAIVNPSREKTWILLGIVPGILPYVITQIAHTGRLAGALPPFYLLAALGLERFLSIFSKKAETWSLRFLGIFFLATFWIWSGWANIQSAWAWSNFPKSVLVNVWKQATAEVDHGRIYIAPFFVDYDNLEALQTLINHQDIYGLGSSNPIFLSPGKKRRML